MARYPGKNPFDSEEEDDSFVDIDSANMTEVQRQKMFYQDRMVDSTYRSLRVLEETQQVAAETGVNLHRQGQQLNNVENNLDKMDSDMKVADRNVTSIKSIWGTIGNYFRKEPKPNEANASKTEEIKQEASGLKQTASSIKYSNKPKSSNDPVLGGNVRLETSRKNDPNYIMDKNLDLMLGGLQSLKQNAVTFGQEIDIQNAQIDRINTKSERVNMKVESTNSDIRKIL